VTLAIPATLGVTALPLAGDAALAASPPDVIGRTARILNRYPDRILFGTDNVPLPDQVTRLRVRPWQMANVK
jgi:hypothetical protein